MADPFANLVSFPSVPIATSNKDIIQPTVGSLPLEPQKMTENVVVHSSPQMLDLSFFNTPTTSPTSHKPQSIAVPPVSPAATDPFAIFSNTSSPAPTPAPTPTPTPTPSTPIQPSAHFVIENSSSCVERISPEKAVQQTWTQDGSDDLFEQAYEITKTLQDKLKANQCHHFVEQEMGHLLNILSLLETETRERDEDSRRLLNAFKNAKEKPTAPLPPSDNEIVASPTPIPSPVYIATPLQHREYSHIEIRKITMIQRYWRNKQGSLKTGHLADIVLFLRSNPTEESKKHTQWHKTLRELIRSEHLYVRKLYILIQYFLAPLEKKLDQAQEAKNRANNTSNSWSSGLVQLGQTLTNAAECKVITPTEFQKLFMNIKVIYSFHSGLLKSLKQMYFLWPRKPIVLSLLFQQMAPYFKSYCTYTRGYHEHLNTLISLKTNKYFSVWLQGAQKSIPSIRGINVTNITDLTIAPIQRIPIYVSMLKEFLDLAPLQFPDREPLTEAILDVQKLFDYICDDSKASENLQVLFKMQNMIVGPSVPNLMEKKRFYVRDGPILILTDRIHRRHLYVCSDMLLLTKTTWRQSEGEQAFDFSIPLIDAVVTDDIEVPFSFRICYNQGRESMSFVSSSHEEKAVWMRDITNASASSVSNLCPSDSDHIRDISRPQKTESKNGYLSKMEGGFIKTWKTRYIKIIQGILYSFESDAASIPLRSYHLREFIIKQFYVTDNYTRYCVHMIQCNGKRQIILSTHSKTILEEWLLVLKQSVDMQHSLVFSNPSVLAPSLGGTLDHAIDPPVIVTSSEESEKSFQRSGGFSEARFFPEEVTDEFMDVVDGKRTVSLYMDSNSQSLQFRTPSSAPPPVNRENKQFLPDSPPPIRWDPPVSKKESEGDTLPPSFRIPVAVVQFQVKFGLPPSERPLQCFPLASSCYIYLTQHQVCVESLFQGNQTISLSDIAFLHKSKVGLLGKGTGGRIELKNGIMIELSGMIHRRDTFQAITEQATKLNHNIITVRDE